MFDNQAAKSPAQKITNSVKAFSCPSCGQTIKVSALGISTNISCSYCFAVVDLVDENYQIIAKFKGKNRRTDLNIGDCGTIKNVKWEVIGYMEKASVSDGSTWEEYLLFNPYHGFRFLVNYNGHWNFVKTVRTKVEGNFLNLEKVKYDGKTFKPYLRDKAKVKYVKGEFYWRVKKGDVSLGYDYICPPFMLSFEIEDGGNEVNISLGEYFTDEQVVTAFNLDEKRSQEFSETYGVGANQPSPYLKRLKSTVMIMLLSIMMLFFSCVYFQNKSHETNIMSSVLTVRPEMKNQSILVGDFDVPKQGNVELEINADVVNGWADLQLELVNTGSGKRYESAAMIEYYFYRDDDDAIKVEGSKDYRIVIPQVQRGHYKLLADIDSSNFSNFENLNVGFILKSDVAMIGNLFLTFVLIILYPLYLWMMNKFFEQKRQENEYFDDVQVMEFVGESVVDTALDSFTN